MTSTQVVETSVISNSSFQNYPHPGDYTIQNAPCYLSEPSFVAGSETPYTKYLFRFLYEIMGQKNTTHRY